MPLLGLIWYASGCFFDTQNPSRTSTFIDPLKVAFVLPVDTHPFARDHLVAVRVRGSVADKEQLPTLPSQALGGIKVARFLGTMVT